MFRGDDPSLRAVMACASVAARNLGHPRVDSEHLPLALAQADGAIAFVLARHGAKAYALREAVQAAGPQGAGMAADHDALAPLGVRLAATLSPTEQPVGRSPLFPLGAERAAARRGRPPCRRRLDAGDGRHGSQSPAGRPR